MTDNNGVICMNDFEDQLEEICLTAVKQNGMALKNVIKQTPKICFAAV